MVAASHEMCIRDSRKIDKVMEKQFGWPMGPAYLLDVVGIDTAHHAQAVMAAGFPPVSYTHLDVYKRQNHDFGTLAGGLGCFPLHDGR